MMNFRTFLRTAIDENRPVFLDGGMGTMIHASGVTGFAIPESLCFSHPALISSIHEKYIQAGAHILTTCTFGANPLKLAGHHLATKKVYAKAVECIRSALEKSESGTPHFIAGDIGPVGQLVAPLGKLPFDEAYEAFRASAIAAEEAGADLILLETFTDLYELKAAILAAKENTSLPILASMAFEADRRTLTGSSPLEITTLLESLHVDALGFNCGGSLEDADFLARQFTTVSSLPVMAQPNAGIPVVEEGKTVFKIGPEPFASQQVENAKHGVRILGGCCGTTPAHIETMIRALPKNLPLRPTHAPTTRVSSARETVELGNHPGGTGPVIIGERINPTGKKRCKEALLANDMTFVLGEAENQIKAGAQILDVNVGLPGINETATMLRVVSTLQKTFNTPLQIDSSQPEVLERALRYVNGKPLVNSVNGKQHVMDAVFPLIQKYGGAVVALCLDENGIPPTAEGRVAIARKIIAEAAKYGITPADILVDTLTLTISSQQKEAVATLHGIETLKREFGKDGLKTVLGVSNISFGLPRREIVNAHFFSMALYAGLDAGIINPLSQEMMNAYRAYCAIAAFDTNCLTYIEKYTGTAAATASVTMPTQPAEERSPKAHTALQEIIIKGFADAAAEETRKLIQTHTASEIVDQEIVPALDEVGSDFEAGKKFLPQLLLSAQTVSNAFSVIKETLAASGKQQTSYGTIIMATVEGDIHDIGKNIVVAMLENYGFTVLDLGKDVKPETIVKRAQEENIRMIGLSALMTTTVESMERTIRALRAAEKPGKPPYHIIVGGAVLTEDYAERIGADGYAKDAMATVNAAKSYFLKG